MAIKCDNSKFNMLRVDTGTARVGGTLIWEYWSGSSWSSLSPTDGTNTLSTTGLQNVTWTSPTDWVKTDEMSEDRLFYVRIRYSAATMTTNPVIDQVFIGDVLEHAVHFPAVSTLTLTDMEFFGYGAAGQPKWMADNSSAGLVTANAGGLTNITEAETDLTGGGSIVVNNAKTVAVVALDATDSTLLQNARLSLEADTGGDLAGSKTTTITTSGTTATATCTAHGMKTGDTAIIRGANEEELNGIFTITVTGANTFTYTIVSIGGASGTGTITTTNQILEGLTDVNGLIQTTGFNYTNDQPVVGRMRKSTSSPLYKSSRITGTITIDGFSTNAPMILDE